MSPEHRVELFLALGTLAVASLYIVAVVLSVLWEEFFPPKETPPR